MSSPLRRPFLLYIPHACMPAGVSEEILGMVYAPQLVCSFCGNFLTYGFLYGTQLVGYECGDGFGATKTWVQTMEKARAYQSLEAFRKEERVSSKQVGMLRGLSCMTQLWPANRFAAGMFKSMQATMELTADQKTTIRNMLEERGGWEALIERRDHIYRCEVMEMLYQAGELFASEGEYAWQIVPYVTTQDLADFRSLKADAYRRGLSEKQTHKLYKMEETYLELKKGLTRQVGKILFQGRDAK